MKETFDISNVSLEMWLAIPLAAFKLFEIHRTVKTVLEISLKIVISYEKMIIYHTTVTIQYIVT